MLTVSPSNRLKQMHSPYFQNPALYRQVMKILESYRFRLHVRRQIIELFPKFVLEEIVRDGMKDLVAHEARTRSLSQPLGEGFTVS